MFGMWETFISAQMNDHRKISMWTRKEVVNERDMIEPEHDTKYCLFASSRFQKRTHLIEWPKKHFCYYSLNKIKRPMSRRWYSLFSVSLSLASRTHRGGWASVLFVYIYNINFIYINNNKRMCLLEKSLLFSFQSHIRTVRDRNDSTPTEKPHTLIHHINIERSYYKRGNVFKL